ncbi:MAG: hypothetical protein J6M18_05030 [Actinomycetaceae bacterium]|nr:hypothetical protein [Actinomycetaceae bacterium]
MKIRKVLSHVYRVCVAVCAALVLMSSLSACSSSTREYTDPYVDFSESLAAEKIAENEEGNVASSNGNDDQTNASSAHNAGESASADASPSLTQEPQWYGNEIVGYIKTGEEVKNQKNEAAQKSFSMTVGMYGTIYMIQKVDNGAQSADKLKSTMEKRKNNGIAGDVYSGVESVKIGGKQAYCQEIKNEQYGQHKYQCDVWLGENNALMRVSGTVYTSSPSQTDVDIMKESVKSWVYKR